MKKSLILCLLFVSLVYCNSCTNMIKYGEIKEQKRLEKMMQKLVFNGSQNPAFRFPYELDTPIYIDTNLIYRDNFFTDSMPVFKGENNITLCEKYSDVNLISKKGVLKIPKHYGNNILPLPENFDFEKDSFTYIFYSMPIWSQSNQVYVIKKFRAAQMPFFYRNMSTQYLFMDINGKLINSTCQNLHFKSVESLYWNKRRRALFGTPFNSQMIEEGMNFIEKQQKGAIKNVKQ